MKILLLNWRDIHHPNAGGAEQVTMEHAIGWVKKGHSVTWITSWYEGAKKDEVIDGITIMRRAGSLTVYPWAFIYTAFHSSLFDIVIDEIHAIPFFTPLATQKPKIAFIHEIAGNIWDYMAPFPINIFGKLFERLYFPMYKHIPFWTDAQSTVDELVSMGIPRHMCTVIPCPISSQEFVQKRVKKESHPTFLFVSRVVAMKGIEEILKAFYYILTEMPAAKLWIVGGGEETYLASLRSLIHEYHIDKSVVFWGKVSEEKKVSLMSSAHILLHASVKEGWGLVVLEAANHGTPSVVYNVSGLKDVVKHNKTGIVLEQNSPQYMAKAAIALYKDKHLYKEFQKNGKEWVSSLKWDDVIKQSTKFLEQTIKKSKGR